MAFEPPSIFAICDMEVCSKPCFVKESLAISRIACLFSSLFTRMSSSISS
ncbi:Uncharacterised protein [Vibrio cholerae]|nr:Uncharacterised protein [Vibrio cholerae]